MNDYYKNQVVKSLSKVLPSLLESINNLLVYVKSDGEYNSDLVSKLDDLNRKSSLVTSTIKKELDVIRKTLEKPEEIDLERITLELDTITSILNEALWHINNSVSTLIYLVAKERNLLEILNSTNAYESVIKMEPDISQAVDYLYLGSKKLIEIIDIVTND